LINRIYCFWRSHY